MDKVRVKIVGATGYTGGELVRLLINHPGVELVGLTAKIPNPMKIYQEFPHFRNICDLTVYPAGEEPPAEEEVVFLSVPHRVAMEQAPFYLEKGVRVIDLSADFRFSEPAIYEKWYGVPNKAEDWLKKAVYGLPELFAEEIKNAQLLANPGCYPTSVILGLAPLTTESIKSSVNWNSLVVDAKSGISGAGRNPKLTFHFPERSETINAYRIGNHQHTPEIENILSRLLNANIQITFVPHLIPINRGILSTIYLDLTNNADVLKIREAYNAFTKNKPFYRLWEDGSQVSVGQVRNTNFIDVGLSFDVRKQRLIITSAIDNLIKGAAGQAVQNFNLMYGFSETTGLTAMAEVV